AHGLRLCRNFFVTKQGNAISRPGTTFVAETTSGARLIPFVFSADDALVLEFRDKAIRFHKNGAPILVNKEGKIVPTGGKPYEVATTWAGFEVLRELRYVQMGNVLLLTGPGIEPHELIRRSDADWKLRAI